ncbi:hypothetical protein [Desulforamulus hydrothermalis]|uniref:Uncharacterized protein n=1 Tax=Desulforamulus hydrothermalis Lam5 = DSM 18033 TaxID=1121428 RepID=K8E026_9FIRM|nr:hypothetical protein [Desulforamulus hydrothermalis]CCO08735.1 conserved hypothetical protein [Desulforamulus hydrothermalis Lam5 = DSM 18033]SHG70284.1 hypothetical protein SAMN02745177_00043 [Desulforamulus hydrothermalis Lam5 = DSM 18033]
MKKPPANQESLTRKEALDRVRSQQRFIDPNRGPARKDANRHDINDPLN